LKNLKSGESFVHEAKILVSAVGGYTNLKYLVIPGIEILQGHTVHTAKWDQGYDLKGRNVIVVGNGCK
jgi:cation diffusion facilitator CzcD-associated flavoprotein CzcO